MNGTHPFGKALNNIQRHVDGSYNYNEHDGYMKTHPTSIRFGWQVNDTGTIATA